jgi:hypothetical protein
MRGVEFARIYKSMSTEDRRTFDRWLKANAFAGLLFTTVVVVMAVAGAMSGERREATVADATPPALSKPSIRQGRTPAADLRAARSISTRMQPLPP